MAPISGKNLMAKDVGQIDGTANFLFFMYDNQGVFEGTMEKNMEIQGSMKNLTVQSDPPGKQRLTPEGDKRVKDTARDYRERIERYDKETLDQTPASPAKDLHHELLRGIGRDLGYMEQGISGTQDPEFMGAGSGAVESLLPQLDTKLFQPDRIEQTSKTLQEYPLDKYVKLGNDLQEKHADYELGKESRSDVENARLWKEMREDKQNLLSMARDLYEKTKNPTPDQMALFGNKEYMVGKNGFIGIRGLEGMIGKLEKDLLSITTTAEMQELGDSLGQFNTARAGIFKKESDEHKAMREATEKMQENMKRLEEGTVIDKETGKPRPMNASEREGMIKETWDSIRTMQEKTDQYIAHAAPNGKQPNTSAGKERLAGAMKLKGFADRMRARFEELPAVQTEMKREQEAKFREDDAKFRESLSGGAQKFYDSKMKSFQQFDGMSHNSFHDASPNARYFGVNNFELMAAEMIAMSVVKEGIKGGQIEAADISREHEKAVKNIMKDERFEKWKDTFKDNVDAQRRIGPMTADELRVDFVNSISKEMQAAGKVSPAKETEKTKTAEKKQAKTKETAKKETKKEIAKKKETPKKSKPAPSKGSM